MAARAVVMCMLAAHAHAFTFSSSLPLRAQLPSTCSLVRQGCLILKARKTEEDELVDTDVQSDAVGVDKNWFERTTSADREYVSS